MIVIYFVDLSRRITEFKNLFSIRTVTLTNNVKVPSISSTNKSSYLYSFNQKQFEFKGTKSFNFILDKFYINFQQSIDNN